MKMKMTSPLVLFMCLVAIGLAIAVVGCSSAPTVNDPSVPPKQSNTLTSVAQFKTWLNGQRANTAAAPYAVALKVSNLTGFKEALWDNEGKYVSLDLSGSTITSIEDRAFAVCVGLTRVTIPGSVVSIGEGAFYGCSSLIGVIIPNSVTSIDKNVFVSCSSLTGITIPDSVTGIGPYAFSGCSSLKSVTIPKSVSSISLGLFGNCSSLTSVTIPDSVTSIGDGAFIECKSLKSIIIPASVTGIGKYIFDSCPGLTSVTFEGTISPAGLSDNAFEELGDLRDKYLSGGRGAYTRAGGGSTWTKQ
jgi:hypothetical protein